MSSFVASLAYIGARQSGIEFCQRSQVMFRPYITSLILMLAVQFGIEQFI
jgi:hypothetical protein